jgi:uncharacterized phiE125 gp8 family phage protein
MILLSAVATLNPFYTLTTPGDIPVSLTEMRAYLKDPPSSDDPLISDLIVAATRYGENYTAREFRINAWTLLLDDFAPRIPLDRDPVGSITEISYKVDGDFTTITGSTYYLKQGVQGSEVLLQDAQVWPTDLDSVEHGVKIEFATFEYSDIDQIKLAIKRHVALLYQHRNDCPDPSDVIGLENVNMLYNQYRIPRI